MVTDTKTDCDSEFTPFRNRTSMEEGDRVEGLTEWLNLSEQIATALETKVCVPSTVCSILLFQR